MHTDPTITFKPLTGDVNSIISLQWLLQWVGYIMQHAVLAK